MRWVVASTGLVAVVAIVIAVTHWAQGTSKASADGVGASRPAQRQATPTGMMIESPEGGRVLVRLADIAPRPEKPLVVEEFDIARKHYERLGLADRMEMDLHDGGHEARVESGLKFLARWLMDRRP